MVLMLRNLPKLGYSGANVETISSVFTTWGPKINSIVIAIANGLIISLIPHIVSLYVKKDNDGVNKIFNKSLKIVLLVIIPLSVFLSLNANSIWMIFYGESKFGPSIIRFNILLTILDSIYIIVNSLLQSLSKYKLLFISVILGILINIGLDVPLMHLFNSIGLNAYHGAIFSTFIGLSISVIIPIIYLKKELKFSFNDTLKTLPRTLFNIIVVIIVDLLLSMILPMESTSRFVQIFNICILGIVTVPLYLVLSKNYLSEVLPEKILKLLRKFKIPV